MSDRLGGAEGISATIGRLLALAERAETDRQEINRRLDKFGEGQDAMRGEVRGLAQSQNTMAGSMAELAREKLATRLKDLEDIVLAPAYKDSGVRLVWVEGKVKGWEKALGTGRALLLKIITVLMGSSIFAGVVSRILAHFGF